MFQDLSGLLKSLYDAVGSSIKIPSNGTKTLKLRLTVGQDGSQLTDMTLTPGKTTNVNVKDISKDKVKVNKESKSPKSKELPKVNNLTVAQTDNVVKSDNVPCTHVTLSSQQQQELAELVQANMERNRVKLLRYIHIQGLI